jgi:hypothetical protein
MGRASSTTESTRMLTETSLWKTGGSFCVSFAVKFLCSILWFILCTELLLRFSQRQISEQLFSFCFWFSFLPLFFFNLTTNEVFLFSESLQQLNGWSYLFSLLEVKGKEKEEEKEIKTLVINLNKI